MSEQLPISLLSSLISKLKIKNKTIMNAADKALKALRFGFLITKGFGAAAVDKLSCGLISKDLVEAGFDGAARAAKEADGTVGNLDPAVSIQNLKKEFEKCVEQALTEQKKKRIVVFIDDLDRLNPGKAVELLEVLKLFLDCKNCVFVLAIDYDVVCRGVEIKYGLLANDEQVAAEKGRSFFDKIIQVPFKVPVARYNIDKYVKNCFKQIHIELQNQDDLDVYVDLIKYSIGTNPRSMKRLFNAFQLLLTIVPKDKFGDKIKNRQLLFAILCLQHCSEPIYNFMIRNSDELSLELINSLLNGEYDKFVDLAKENDIDIDNMAKNDFDSAKLFLEKLRIAIDLDGENGIEEKELGNFKQVMQWSAITNATDTESSTVPKRGSISIEFTGDNYNEIDLYGNSEADVLNILGLIGQISPDIHILLVHRNKSDDCIRGKVGGKKTMIDVYGHSKGYYCDLTAPDEQTLSDSSRHPDITQLMQDMKVSPMRSYPKTVRIIVNRDELQKEKEESIIKLGQLIYNEWITN